MQTGNSAESLAGQVAAAFQEYRSGRTEAMDGLVDSTTSLLWHTARAQGLTQQQAEDAVQTTWLLLVQHASSITEPRGVLKWLLTTVRREAWSTVRRARREDARDDLTDVAPELPGEHLGPEDMVVRGQDQRVLWRHFTTLPDRCQRLLRVVALAERPDYAQVAESLGMPVGSIGPTRGRCLAKLRAALTADPAWEVTA
ncbi:MAG TPA: sigma-70 family RNA polymerase sigma factor [Pedococcus sp.]|jgi:RNA polymerase sigma factor (sigma-70 family)|nr:sigma-70 family RNA polymerase sigma factor [Pedococcus sp.]